MSRELAPRKHAAILKIYERAKIGDSFFVNRAAANGDLAPLSEEIQRLISAVANDQAAAFTYDQIIPLTDDKYIQHGEFIEKHLNLAFNLFTKSDGKSIKEEISNFYNNLPLASSN